MNKKYISRNFFMNLASGKTFFAFHIYCHADLLLMCNLCLITPPLYNVLKKKQIVIDHLTWSFLSKQAVLVILTFRHSRRSCYARLPKK